MNKLKKIWFSLFFIGVVISLGACGYGSTVDTKLTINDDYSGKREISVNIEGSQFGEYFDGTYDDFAKVVQANCPSELTYTTTTDGDGVIYNFALSFSNIDDYKTKVAAILGKEPSIEVKTPDSVWASGIYLNEDFSSTDLLKWLSEAIVEEGYVSSSYSSSIFNSGETTVDICNDTKTTGTNIHIDTLDYVRIFDITVKTKINAVNNYDINLVFNVESGLTDTKKSDIETFFNDRKTLGDLGIEESDNGIVYTLSAKGASVEDINKFYKSVLGKEKDCVVVKTGDNYDMGPFNFGETLYYSLDFSGICVENTYTPVNFYVAGNGEYKFGEVTTDNFAEKDYIDSDEEGYSAVAYGGSSEETDVTISFAKTYKMKKVSTVFDENLLGKYTKTVEFTFENAPSEEDLQVIVGKFEECKAKWGTDSSEETSAEGEEASQEENPEESTEIKYADVKIDTENKDGVVTLSVKQKGTVAEINATTDYIYGFAGKLAYTTESGFAKVNKYEAVKDSGNYYFVTPAQDFESSYLVKTSLGGKVDKSCEGFEEADGGYIVENNSVYFDVDYLGTYVDIVAILFWVSIVLAVACVVIAIFRSGLIKFKVSDGGNATAQPEVQSAPVAENPVTAIPAKTFCVHCGAMLSPDAVFCENCGNKVE